jgi:hypothetical protein
MLDTTTFDEFWVHLSRKLKLPPDQIKLMVSLLLQAPLGLMLKSIHNPAARHIFSISAGLILDFFVFGHQTFYVIAWHVGMYFFMMAFKRSAALVGVVGMFGLLSYYNIQKILFQYGEFSIDLTLLIMNQVTKGTYFGWAVQDMHSEDKKSIPDELRANV